MPLYSNEERAKRDASKWTRVQAILAPVQFVVFMVSAVLVIRFLSTGAGYVAATTSVMIKTAVLYSIMVTGALWERDVFGRYLFAHAFFWEDLVSMVVIALHSAYVICTLWLHASPRWQMDIALAAYAAYAINAAQFLIKFKAARAERPIDVLAPALHVARP